MTHLLHRLFAALLTLALVAPGAAQVQRQFPQNALRGQIEFGQPPQVAVNGETKRLAPGARIRAADNMIVLSGSLVGRAHPVHYTIDPLGDVKDVWILRADELANQPWPSNAAEAASWSFNLAAQRWTRP